MIPITKPFLPPQEEYNHYLNDIWHRNWLTNNGPLVNELELQLKKYLRLRHLLFLGNGTIALQIAIKALGLKGEIITTPFSYVATTSSIVWENCEPVFVDIDSKSLNIDPYKIESAITSNTSAILATHVYGNPCEIDIIADIARKHNLKVIYDAAHAFNVNFEEKSIFQYGDISTASFHATKLFHTVEGGAVFTKDPALLKIMASMRSFGHETPYSFSGIGINGKNSELHAAMGLCVLKHIDEIIAKRKKIFEYYDTSLNNLDVTKPVIHPKANYNFAYYPVIFSTSEQMQKTLSLLNKREIFPRRYFYPSLSTLPYVKKYHLPITESIVERVLCLPLYHDLSKEEIDYIARLCLRVQNYDL